MRISRSLGAFLVVSGLLATGPLRADVKAELGFGWSLTAPAFSTSYLSQFSPPMTPAANAISSSATQTVHLKGKIGYGMSGFFNVLIGDTFGVQVLVDYFRPNLGGVNSDYNVNLTYYLTNPSDQYVYSKQGAWPDSKGDFSETTFSLNGIVRFPLSYDLSFSLSGGVSAFYLSGEAMPMGFWSFGLEQVNNVNMLDIKSYELVYNFGSKTTYGGNLGGELAYSLIRSVTLSLDLRYFLSPKADFQMNITPNAGLTDPVEPIAEALNLGSIRINPSYLRLNLTLRFRF
jgi:hypothetical protein